MLQWLVEIQRDIYLTFAGHIKAFAAGGGWTALAAFLPMGIVFGAVHAMTPGHSKSVLATYLAGSPSGMGRSLMVSLVLSFTHVGMAVMIAALSLPLVSVVLGSVGRAPLLEDLSRGLLGHNALRGRSRDIEGFLPSSGGLAANSTSRRF